MLSSFHHVQIFVTQWVVSSQTPLSMGFSRPEYCSRLPCPPSGDLSGPGIKFVSPVAPALQADLWDTREKIQHARHCTLKKKKNSYFHHCFFSFSLSRVSLPGRSMLISLFRDNYKYLFSFSLTNSICNWSFSLQWEMF